MPAIPYRKTPTSDKSWDGPKNEANLKTGQDESYYKKAYAWQDPDRNPKTKAAYKFIHHEVDSDGNIGAANIKGCISGIAVLNGAMGGTNIPKADYEGVYNHLAKHVKDAGQEPPELKRSLETSKEIRTLTTKIELRSADDGDNQQEVIEGYALKFNKWSDTMGTFLKFREKIDPNALEDCDMSNVVATFNHDENMPLGRNTIKDGIGSLQLSVDNIGLKFRCIPADTSYARDLKENIKAGVINQCSFSFTLADDDDADSVTYDEESQTYERTINKIGRIYDIAVVTTPAYPDTEVVIGQRSLSKIQNDVLRKKLIIKTYL
jgi:hypothetical protein